MLLLVAAILSGFILFNTWLRNNPPEIRNYTDPTLFMWAAVPILLLFLALSTWSNNKSSLFLLTGRITLLIMLAGSIAVMIFMFIAVNSLGS